MIFVNSLLYKMMLFKNFLNDSIYIFNAADIPPYNYKNQYIITMIIISFIYRHIIHNNG